MHFFYKGTIISLLNLHMKIVGTVISCLSKNTLILKSLWAGREKEGELYMIFSLGEYVRSESYDLINDQMT